MITEEQVYDVMCRNPLPPNGFSTLGIATRIANKWSVTIPQADIIKKHCQSLIDKGLIEELTFDLPKYKALTPHEIVQRKLGK